MAVAIKVEDLSKQYRLGQIGTGAFAHDLNRWWHTIRGKEDPYLKIGEANDRSTTGNSEYVWSLQDINFEIKQGGAVGIIGRNGAGKSTLLKILSKVTAPTTGRINVKGRIASLLEVGTGFHPELTGKENIYLNGAILGMRRKEITRKFDEIVDFSGVERYIDTPVKRYSSGMYVRLAFAVAAHLESEILIVDEVLAVGDAEFQKKCLGKMGDVSKGEGRTILFVSHNMAAVSNLCDHSILLQNGQLKEQGATKEIIEKYISIGKVNSAVVSGDEIKADKKCSRAEFVSICLSSEKQGSTSSFGLNEDVLIDFEFKVVEDNSIISPSIHLLDTLGTCILATFNANSVTLNKDELYGKPLRKGNYRSRCIIPQHFLNTQSYSLSAFLVPEDVNDMGIAHEVISFSVEETGEMRKEYSGGWIGLIRPKLYWKTQAL